MGYRYNDDLCDFTEYSRNKISERSVGNIIWVCSDYKRSKTEQYSIHEIYQSSWEAEHEPNKHTIVHWLPMT